MHRPAVHDWWSKLEPPNPVMIQFFRTIGLIARVVWFRQEQVRRLNFNPVFHDEVQIDVLLAPKKIPSREQITEIVEHLSESVDLNASFDFLKPILGGPELVVHWDKRMNFCTDYGMLKAFARLKALSLTGLCGRRRLPIQNIPFSRCECGHKEYQHVRTGCSMLDCRCMKFTSRN